jgi:hypothetical protein
MRLFAIRTVKQGTVKISGQIMRPREYYMERDGWPCTMPYRGQLDGMRLAFGRYWIGQEYEHFASLWGSEEMYHSPHKDVGWPGPNCIGGVFYWDWWYTEDKWQKTQEIWVRCSALSAVNVPETTRLRSLRSSPF